jgi:hypothetical protein
MIPEIIKHTQSARYPNTFIYAEAFMKVLLSVATCLLTVNVTFSVASAQIIYSDTFSRVTGSGDANGDPNGPGDNFSDWGSNDNGLGGTNVQAWNAGPDRALGGRNAVTDGDRGFSFGSSSFYELDVTSSAPDGFTIALDFRRYPADPATPPGPNGYIAFGLGVDLGSEPLGDALALNNSDWAILFQQANNGNTGNSTVYTDSAPVTNFDYGDPDIEHSLLLTVTPQTSGAYGDSDSVDVNVLIDGTLSQDFTTTGGADFGTFTVSANNFEGRYIDNLVVSAFDGGGPLLGDFDNDGDVDLADLDQYNGNIGMAATGALESLDLNNDGTVGADDFAQHYTDLVETSNGQKGTFAGDLNLDGTVNVLGDAFALVGNLNNPASSWSQGDFNGDGTVNVLGDAFALVGNLNKTNAPGGAAAVSAVPEPASLSLVALIGLTGLCLRRR